MSLANGDSEEYFAAAGDGRLIFQQCRSCKSVQFPPRHHCAACWGTDLEWIESKGKGKVESFTIVRRAPLPEFRDRAPYVVGSVIVDEGPRMITNIIGDDALDVRIGDPVVVAFETSAEGDTLPQFRRVPL